MLMKLCVHPTFQEKIYLCHHLARPCHLFLVPIWVQHERACPCHLFLAPFWAQHESAQPCNTSHACMHAYLFVLEFSLLFSSLLSSFFSFLVFLGLNYTAAAFPYSAPRINHQNRIRPSRSLCSERAGCMGPQYTSLFVLKQLHTRSHFVPFAFTVPTLFPSSSPMCVFHNTSTSLAIKSLNSSHG